MAKRQQTILRDASFQPSGAIVSLRDLLLQRYTARLLEYAAYKRSVGGISGLHLSRIRGRGIDFEEFRPYQPGDDIRTIDWRVTARTGKPYTKVFREERERPVLIAIDQSNSMFFGSHRAFKSVTAAQAAAIFGWLALDNGDRVGGLIYNDESQELIRPRRSRRSALHLLNRLQHYNNALAEQRAHDSDPETNGNQRLASALFRIQRITRPGSTLYLISDFRSMDQAALQYLRHLSRHNNVVCCFVYDALEEELPQPGFYNITDGQETGTLNTFDRKARQHYRESFNQRVKQLQDELTRLQIPLISLRTDQSVPERIQQWLTTIL